MASSFSSSRSLARSSSQSWNHDVFLNYRGEDTGNNFVDHLYTALVQQGIYTYKSDETLDQGDSLRPAIWKAISESRISIVVFSENYAHSSWCLDELLYIMECKDEIGQIVMPIFHHVDPSTVRRQKGYYGDAFHIYEEYNMEKVECWRKALSDASNILGWETAYFANGKESRCIKEVVDRISNKLFPNAHIVKFQDVGDMKISLRKLTLATENFSNKYVITKSGFGTVYKARYEDGYVAVKKLNPRFGQGDQEFMTEIALLSAYKHENIVSLVGFCDQSGEKILVYKYESNGSLDQHLNRKDLTWIQRLRICLDVARGLKYLHDDIGTQHRILHRDMKSANILLDKNFKAKISDFGLSKIGLANVPCTALITRVCGTPGYCDPEYYKHGILTQKSDVYSFGVVMFEVLCGKLVGVSKHCDELFSADLAQNHYENGTLDEIIDSDLRNQMNSASSSKYSAIAHQCLKSLGKERPIMSVVVKQLEKALGYQQDVSLT